MSRVPVRVVVRCALYAQLLPLARVDGQAVRTLKVGAPNATFDEPFSRVSGLRELSDGRLVVLDGIELRIAFLDLRAHTSTPIGRSGRGPGEFTLPLQLVAIGGDTTLAVDMTGGGRALVITSQGASKESLRSARFAPGAPLFYGSDIQADLQGRTYELVQKVRDEGGRSMLTGLWGVRRLDRSTGSQDTIGEVSRMGRSPLLRPQRATTRPAPAAGGAARGEQRVGGAPPFLSIDQWAVAPDGRIAFVTVDPYRVTFVAASGARVEGPPVPYTPVPVGAALKEQWRQRGQQPVSTLTFGPNGVSAGRSRPTYNEPDAWPDVLPPFLFQPALRFAPDGTLWIERATAAADPQTFDLIDPAGKLSARVVLPARTRLVGFGVGSVYTVRIDADDLEYVQRHGLPK